MCNIKSFLWPNECRLLWDCGLKMQTPQYWWAKKFNTMNPLDKGGNWEIMTQNQMDNYIIPLGCGIEKIPAMGVSEICHFLKEDGHEINIIPKNGKYKVSIFGRNDFGFEEEQLIDALFKILYELIDLKNIII